MIAAERKASDRGLEIEALKLTIAKLQRNTFGASSDSGKKLLDQLELQLAELEEGMAEDEAAVEIVAPPRLGRGGQRRRGATSKARSPAAPQPSAARARRACGTVLLSQLRRVLEEARRGRH